MYIFEMMDIKKNQNFSYLNVSKVYVHILVKTTKISNENKTTKYK